MKLHKTLFLAIFLLFFFSLFSFTFAEEQISTDNTYKLEIDNDGLGDDTNSPSSTDQTSQYRLTGALEVFDQGYGDATGSGTGDYKIKTGLQPTFEANVSQLSLLSNTDGTLSLYNRLLFKINPSGNPTTADGVQFAVQISRSSNFATYYYLNPTSFQIDTITNPSLYTYYRPCAQTIDQVVDADRWDCGTVSGLKRYINGLAPRQTYYVRVVAMNGDATNSEPGPYMSATTQNLYLSLVISNHLVTFNNLRHSAVNTSTPTVTVTAGTNSTTGYTARVYGRGNNSGTVSGLYSTVKNYLIASTSGLLTPGSEGYGMQANVNTGTPSISSTWALTGNYVGQILRTSQVFFSNTSPTNGDTVNVIFKATITPKTPAATDYRDYIYYTLGLNP